MERERENRLFLIQKRALKYNTKTIRPYGGHRCTSVSKTTEHKSYTPLYIKLQVMAVIAINKAQFVTEIKIRTTSILLVGLSLNLTL
jgi:hypothetical protein